MPSCHVLDRVYDLFLYGIYTVARWSTSTVCDLCCHTNLAAESVALDRTHTECVHLHCTLNIGVPCHVVPFSCINVRCKFLDTAMGKIECAMFLENICDSIF